MDREELEELAFHRKNGRPETTRGPYYHKTWWESYKGAVKGILGGIMVGGMVGAIAGGAVIGVLALATAGTGALTTPLVGGILAATTLFGMHEGKEKFEKIGIATGAVAAAQEISEVRMKEYTRDKLTELTNEIRELKAAVAGKIPKEAMHVNAVQQDNAAIFDETDFKGTHQTDHEEGSKGKLFYPNVAMIGAVVGAGVMAVMGFAFPEALPHFVEHFLGVGAETASGTAFLAKTAMISSGAALGATFGVSRDIFRKIFDVTDCWFMGVVDGTCNNQEIAQAKGKTYEPLPSSKPVKHEFLSGISDQALLSTESPQNPDVPTPLVHNAFIIEPQQSSYFQDKIDAQTARKALLSMDHNTARMH